MKVRPINAFWGMCHLLGNGLWMPERHRVQMDLWGSPAAQDVRESDVRTVMDHWAEQLHFAWALARLSAWSNLAALFLHCLL